jgi:hypothetical protein
MTSLNKNPVANSALLGVVAVNSEAVYPVRFSVFRSSTSLEVHHFLYDGFAFFGDGFFFFREGCAVFAELLLLAGHGHGDELVDVFSATLANGHVSLLARGWPCHNTQPGSAR